MNDDSWLAADPAELFEGVVLLAVPHMDDEVLGCGGTLARLPDPTRVHVVYATDGRRSPEPLLPWTDRVDRDRLALDRAQEAREALESLGVPREQLHFLGLPDSGLQRCRAELLAGLRKCIQAVRPRHLLAPFRYDRHPDHLALNRAATECRRSGAVAELTEYFVYHHSRLLARGDVRAYIAPEALVRVDVESVARRKYEALRCFRSQTTRYYPWQTRPNLTEELLREVSRAPELFLRYDPKVEGAAIFESGAAWIRLANRLEPLLKKRKDQLVALGRRIVGRRSE